MNDSGFKSVFGTGRGQPTLVEGQPTTVTFRVEHLTPGCELSYQIIGQGRRDSPDDKVGLTREAKAELRVGDGVRFECVDPDAFWSTPYWGAWTVTGNPRDCASFELSVCRVLAEGVLNYFAYCPDETCDNAWPLGSQVPARCPEHELHVAFGLPVSG